MSIIINKTTRVMIQGITGREGMVRTRLMKEYGTKILAGCTPGKGGQKIFGVPVFDTVEEAVEECGTIDVSVIFVPAPFVKNAALEAISAQIKYLVIIPDRVPVYDVLEIAYTAKKYNCNFLGPNTIGMLSPGEGVLGMIGGRSENIKHWFKKGNVGISSRSGGVTTTLAYHISKLGLGLSTIVHVGGDAFVGMPHQKIMHLFQNDHETKVVVLFGEIGTSQEEAVADMIKNKEFTKPLIVYIGGKTAKKGTRFSHAGAIIEGNRGTYNSKINRLRDAGAIIADEFDKIPEITLKVLGNK